MEYITESAVVMLFDGRPIDTRVIIILYMDYIEPKQYGIRCSHAIYISKKCGKCGHNAVKMR